MQTIAYYILFGLFKAIGALPLRVLYGLWYATGGKWWTKILCWCFPTNHPHFVAGCAVVFTGTCVTWS